MKIMTYDQMQIEIIQATPHPLQILSKACQMTMKQYVNDQEISKNLLSFLITSEHTSILEHIVLTVWVTGVSRSFLAQITRHRHMSPTSSSQHYQDYRDYPIVISSKLLPPQRQTMIEAAEDAYDYYEELVDWHSVIPEEARQVLPNCAAVNLLMTWNLRSLLNLCRIRCCNRNVEEMRIFANRMREIVWAHIPELYGLIGPPCFTDKTGCNQGRMECEQKAWEII